MASHYPAPTRSCSRLIGALALDRRDLRGSGSRPSATVQALIIVLASSVAAGVGISGGGGQIGSQRRLSFRLWRCSTWAAWALLMFEIGTRLMPDQSTRSSAGELLRTLGFAATPGLLRVLGFMPDVMLPVFVVHGGVDARGHDGGRASGAGLSQHRQGRGGMCVRAGLSVTMAIVLGLSSAHAVVGGARRYMIDFRHDGDRSRSSRARRLSRHHCARHARRRCAPPSSRRDRRHLSASPTSRPNLVRDPHAAAGPAKCASLACRRRGPRRSLVLAEVGRGCRRLHCRRFR